MCFFVVVSKFTFRFLLNNWEGVVCVCERVLHTSSESSRFQTTRTPWRASTMILDVVSVMVAPYVECGRDTLHEQREVHLWYLKKRILILVFVK